MRTVSVPAAPTAAPARLRRGDVLVALITWAVGVASLLALPFAARLEPAEAVDLPALGATDWWLVLAALTLQALPVAVARLRPVAALIGVALVPVLLALIGPAAAAGLVTLAPVVVVYRAMLARPELRGAPVVATLLLAVAGVLGAGRDLTGLLTGVAQGVLLVAIGVVTALVVGSRRAVREAQARELRALAREQEALIQRAVATERTAMARELHDIAAHHLSGIALMASAIDRQLDTDPAAAREGLHAVRDQSRVVLTDLRRLVGLLRDGDAAEVSAWDLAAVPDLVRGTAAEIDLRRSQRPLGEGIGPLAQVAAYRMVQESVANARSHAPGADCTVVLDDTDPDVLVVTVRNGPPARGPERSTGGYGLRGMTERAALIGATLRYGPMVDGGWQVRLAIPRDRQDEANEGDDA